MANYHVIGVGEHHKFFDENAYRDSIGYIFRPDHAKYIGGYAIQNLDMAAIEMQATAQAFGKDSGKRIRHSVLSFTPHEMKYITPEKASIWAQRIIRFYGYEYQIVYAVHTNTDNLHIHFVMNQISYRDGHRYRGKKKDYYEFMKFVHLITELPIVPV